MAFDVKVNDMKDGLIMYCTEREDGYGDFASITIKNGFFEFKFDTGSGKIIKDFTANIVLNSDYEYKLSKP